jgi:hypothetical protein
LSTDASTEDHVVVGAKTPRNPGEFLERAMLTQRRPSAPKRIPHFHDDYELGEMLKEGGEGKAYICYKKQKFQGGVHLTFREKKFVVKIMKLEDWKKKGRGNITWEKLLQIKRGQSEIMMSNVHPLIVKHYASYEDEEAHELYVSTTSLHLPSSLTPCACTS